MSRPTVRQAVDDLTASGWVGVRPSNRAGTVGRPAQSYEFLADGALVLGTDVGAYKVVAMIADLSGHVVTRARTDALPTWSASKRLEALDRVVTEVMSAIGDRASRVSFTVVATTGSVDNDGFVVFNTAMEAWKGANPSQWLRERHPNLEVSSCDDMTMSAYAERWLGRARGYDDVLYLHLGRRAGLAALIGGQPHRGAHNAASQVGVWRATPWRNDYSELLGLDSTVTAPGARELFLAAEAGDADARRRTETYFDEIVAGVTPMLVAIDPRLVVIGGGHSRLGELVRVPIADRLARETPFTPEVAVSSLGDEAAALGAVRVALDAAEDHLFRTITVARQDG